MLQVLAAPAPVATSGAIRDAPGDGVVTAAVLVVLGITSVLSLVSFV